MPILEPTVMVELVGMEVWTGNFDCLDLDKLSIFMARVLDL